MTQALSTLFAAARKTDAREDWFRFYKAVAGTALCVPLEAPAGETIRPVEDNGAVRAWPGVEAFAATLEAPAHHAEIDGLSLAGMLSGAGLDLVLVLDVPAPIPAATLGWISETLGAEVARVDRGEGVTVTAPGLPPLGVMQVLGETVGALGADCPEAWLVSMAEPDGAAELVLVLGLSDSARPHEAILAENLTRAVQAVTDQPFAVACPDRGSSLMSTARQSGIGIG